MYKLIVRDRGKAKFVNIAITLLELIALDLSLCSKLQNLLFCHPIEVDNIHIEYTFVNIIKTCLLSLKYAEW